MAEWITDCVMEVVNTAPGLSSYGLNGPVAALYTVVGAMGAGVEFEYMAHNLDKTKWEICKGIPNDSATDTLTRTLVRSSTGALIDWQPGDAPIYISSIVSADRVSKMRAHHRGPTAPDILQLGMIWADSSGGTDEVVWKICTGTVGSGTWVVLWTVNEDTATLSFPATGFTDAVTITSTDAGAAAGPTFTLDRNSASPAASDALGEIPFKGRDSGGGTDVYARVHGRIIDPTAASEDGELRVETIVAGAKADRLAIGAGVYAPGATGGDKGVDTANFAALYLNGVQQEQVLAAQALSGTNFTLDNLPAWVNDIEITLDLFPVDDNVTVNLIMRKSSGTDITSYNGTYLSGNGGTAASSNVSGGAEILIASGVQNDTNVGGLSAKITVFNIRSAVHKRVLLQAGAFDGTSRYALAETWYVSDTAVLTGLKITTSTGGVGTVGRVRVKGCP